MCERSGWRKRKLLSDGSAGASGGICAQDQLWGGDPWRSLDLSPYRFTLLSRVHHWSLQAWLMSTFNCILLLEMEACFVGLYILVSLMQQSLILAALKHRGADITPACPVCQQPLPWTVSVLSSNIPASHVSLLARRNAVRWLFETALLFK